jgi:tagatose-1,6-bisphosphate aldolase
LALPQAGCAGISGTPGQSDIEVRRNMTLLTTSELRGYQQICGENGAIMVIACDQRGGIRQILADTPEERAKISDALLGDVKADVVRHLASEAPCVLLDPVCAVPRVVDDGVLPRDVALLIGLDASGYDADAEGHWKSRLAPGIDARKVRELGGTGGKIMVYLRADHRHANEHNMAIIRRCIEDFAGEDLLLVVEFLTYPLPGEDKAAYKAKLPELIEGGTRLCLDAGAKVLKLPYPGTAQSCAAITDICGDVPWSVLSAGVDHETFLGQVETAMANGASGVIAGRALWKDCVFLDRSKTREALVTKAVPRLREIQSILDRYPRSLQRAIAA